ncbi:hypothetical protein [Streptomyces virginiae]|uniref:hypothetical protein n=1 Tax=Streptomyces virginiae TaxID=1961 RepID=UPI0036B5640A
MNHALRRAMANAKMTEAHLADVCGVDAKTVGRWISEPSRIPHARHRWAASEALGEEESALWPNAVRSALTTGPDREDRPGLSVPFGCACKPLEVARDEGAA